MNAQQQVGLVFCFTFAYAVLRYVICHDVAWGNVPLYILNKSVSWSGVIFFGMSLLGTNKDLRRYYGMWAFAAIMAHMIMSFMVLTPSYFAKFYGAEGRMNGVGEMSMLAGVVGMLFLGGLFFFNTKGGGEGGASLRSGWGRAVLWCAAVHVAVMGYAGWLTPKAWPGYLPPISLLSFLVVIYVLYARNRRVQSGSDSGEIG